MQPPAAYRWAEAQAAAVTLADLPWWQVFDDQSLQALQRDAIAHNLDLRVAVARVTEARALVRRREVVPVPRHQRRRSAMAGNQASRNSQPPGAGQDADRTYNNTTLGVTLSWEADLFGRLRRNDEAAFARYLATEEGRRAVLVTLVSDVASSVLPAARARPAARDRASDAGIERPDGRVLLAAPRRRRVEPARARTRPRRTERSPRPPFRKLKRQIAVLEHAISVLVGRPPGAIDRGRTLDEQHPPPAIPVGLPAQLLERRPDVDSSRAFARRGQCRCRRRQGALLSERSV